MKLVDILNEDQPAKRPQMMPSDLSAKGRKAATAHLSGGDRDVLGVGTNAIVSQSKSPHEMDNVERISNDSDGTSLYLFAVHQTPRMRDNPFLPRVRSHKTEDGVTFTVMEKLYPVTTPDLLTRELTESTWDRLTLRPFPVQRFEKFPKQVLAELIDLAVTRPETAEIIDPQLKQAAEFIRKVQTEIGGSAFVDIHYDNIMWRMTGTMPQIVITDPIYAPNQS